MPIFICSKCGCVDNTATSNYWSLVGQRYPMKYEDDLEQFRGKPLCSDCAELVFDNDGSNPRVVKGKWHGKFEKESATDTHKKCMGTDGIIRY